MEGRDEFLAQLSGDGIELGALSRPCTAPHLNVRFVDRLTREQAFVHYRELIGTAIVEPDIIDEAETLASIADASQDFVIANHVIEHMANPIQALRSWERVLRPGGRLFLAVPDKDHTFDKARDLTPLSHVIEDFEQPDERRDFVHFEDFALRVSCEVIGYKPASEYRSVAKEMYDHRYSIHFHVWNFATFRELLEYMALPEMHWPMRVLRSRPTVGEEFLFLLEKARDAG